MSISWPKGQPRLYKTLLSSSGHSRPTVRVDPELAVNSALDANQCKTLRIRYHIIRAPVSNLIIAHFRVLQVNLAAPTVALVLGSLLTRHPGAILAERRQ